MLRTAFSPCCYKHTLFSRFPHSIYRRQSSSRRGYTRRLFAARKTERRFIFWYSKSHRSSGQKSAPLYAKLAVIAIRAIVCCWMAAKKRNACSSFLGTASTATIFRRRYYRLKRSCTQKSYGRTGSMDNRPKRVIRNIIEMRYAQERTYYENDQ